MCSEITRATRKLQSCARGRRADRQATLLQQNRHIDSAAADPAAAGAAVAGRTSVKPQCPVLIVAPAATAASSASEPRKLGHSRPPGSFFKRIRSEHPIQFPSWSKFSWLPCVVRASTQQYLVCYGNFPTLKLLEGCGLLSNPVRSALRLISFCAGCDVPQGDAYRERHCSKSAILTYLRI